MQNISLLYPENKYFESNDLLDKAYRQLKLNQLISADILKHYTTDIDVISYRHELFKDILSTTGLIYGLQRIYQKLNEFFIYWSEKPGEKDSHETMLRRLVDTEYYIEIMEFMAKELGSYKNEIKSTALKSFYKYIDNEINTDDFKKLKDEIAKLAKGVQNIKSITVGVNLHAQLQPKEAGLLSINDKEFKSGNLLDKILRLDFKDDGYNCLAPLSELKAEASFKERLNIDCVINNAIDRVMRKSLAECRLPFMKYVYDKTKDFAVVCRELFFICKVTEYIDMLRQKEMDVCIPKITTDEKCEIIGVYNPFLCDKKAKDEIVSNDVMFDDNTRIYILTGPNSGGKSVFTNSVAIAQLMFQAGIPIPAKAAPIKICKGIFTHFISEDDIKESGRLEDECRRMAEILNEVDETGIVFMDETFSSTGAEEACELAMDILQKLSDKNCRCIYSTHLHNLAQKATEIRFVDTLSAEISGQRTYKIIRKAPDHSSFAKDIAQKYWR